MLDPSQPIIVTIITYYSMDNKHTTRYKSGHQTDHTHIDWVFTATSDAHLKYALSSK